MMCGPQPHLRYEPLARLTIDSSHLCTTYSCESCIGGSYVDHWEASFVDHWVV